MENEGVNSAVGKEGPESSMTSWERNIEGEEGIEKDLEREIQCLKRKMDSLKITSLETKLVVVAKS